MFKSVGIVRTAVTWSVSYCLAMYFMVVFVFWNKAGMPFRPVANLVLQFPFGYLAPYDLWPFPLNAAFAGATAGLVAYLRKRRRKVDQP